MMAMVTGYIYFMPYQKLYINLTETCILADLVVTLMVALTEQFKVDCVITFHHLIRTEVLFML